jgi:hypothetical protein
MTEWIDPDPELTAAYEDMLERSAIQYKADMLDERMANAGYIYRIEHPEIGPPLYCRTVSEVAYMLREMYPTLSNVNVRKMA